MDLLLPLLGGLALGTIHAFDIDHVAAVTTFTSRHPDAKKAALFGIVWGLGHTATLLLFGAVSVALRFVIPSFVESMAELLVGLLLVAIGVWVLRDLLNQKRIHVHEHTHDGIEHVHFHSHLRGEHHRHMHSMFLVGATHGVAGTASVLIILPLALSHSLLGAVAYLLTFGVGTTTAMGIFAYVMGSLSGAAGARRLLPYVQWISGLTSVSVGLFWIGEKVIGR